MGVSTAVAALAEDLREFDLVKQSFTNSGFIQLLTSFFSQTGVSHVFVISLSDPDSLRVAHARAEWDLRQEQVALIHSALYHFPQEDVERYKLYLQQRIATLKQVKQN
jgi:hypothetical protein